MDDDDDVHDEVGDTESVGVVSPGLRPLEELQHPETNKKILLCLGHVVLLLFGFWVIVLLSCAFCLFMLFYLMPVQERFVWYDKKTYQAQQFVCIFVQVCVEF